MTPDWIDVGKLTALIGQNKSGKSNICEALFKLYPFDESKYDFDFDWPVDRWENKNPKEIVCRAKFALSDGEAASLLAALQPKEEPKAEPSASEPQAPSAPALAKADNDKPIAVELSRNYSGEFFQRFENITNATINTEVAWNAIQSAIPKFVYIFDYDMSGQQVELPQFAQKLKDQDYATLDPGEQTIKIILDLAKVQIDDFLTKGETQLGRTIRSFDKLQPLSFLTRKFQELWKQKKVDFIIEIDGPTLNIFVKDVDFDMPVRLDKRSTGFRWYVSFAWRFTHATAGQFKNVTLLLEEPGIHLHPAGQQDLVKFFDELAQNNQVIYTTHLPYMIDTGTPERVRIVEIHDHHATVIKGIVSPSPQPMMVIEAALGLTPSMSNLLGHRITLIVEGTDDFVILNKLSGVFLASGEAALPEEVYLWPAQGASKTPMYAGFLIGHKWKGGVLLDSDDEGRKASEKIKNLYKGALEGFPVMMLGPAIGQHHAAIAIEDLLPRELYLECVNSAYRIQIAATDLVDPYLRPISVAIEDVLKSRGLSRLDKSRVMGELFKVFDGWKKITDLPTDVKMYATALFKTIREAFAPKASDKNTN